MRKTATNSAMNANVSRNTLMNWNAVCSRSAMSLLRCAPVWTWTPLPSSALTFTASASWFAPASALTTTPVTLSGDCSSSFCAVARSKTASVPPSLPEIPRDTSPTTFGRTSPPGVDRRTVSPTATPADVAVDSRSATWSGPVGALPVVSVSG
ncbi:MAG: hypothetical protein U0R76_14345 [Candidatus Nanopelagicales bacterium]